MAGSKWRIRIFGYILCFFIIPCVMFGSFAYYSLPAQRMSLASIVTSECTLRPGIGKEHEEARWIDANWGDARNGKPGIHYMLNPSLLPGDATIVEIGAWEGRDMQLFMEKSPSKDVQIHAYEPMQHKVGVLASNIKEFGRGQIQANPFGLGRSDRETCFLKDGGTRDEGTRELEKAETCDDNMRGMIRDVRPILAPFRRIDLLHINCEGCEREILEVILQPGSAIAAKIQIIEVQFHAVVSEIEYCNIEALLKANGFMLDYRYQYVWEAWVRKGQGSTGNA